jgi:hypothetical protein
VQRKSHRFGLFGDLDFYCHVSTIFARRPTIRLSSKSTSPEDHLTCPIITFPDFEMRATNGPGWLYRTLHIRGSAPSGSAPRKDRSDFDAPKIAGN